MQPFTNHQTIHALLQWRATHQADTTAFTFLVDGEATIQQLTYAQLDTQARAVGAQLQQVAAPGSRILLLYPPGLEFIAAFFGCLYAGMIATPAYPPHGRRPSPRLAAIAKRAQPALALTTTGLVQKVTTQFAQDPETAQLPIISSDLLVAAPAVTWQPQFSPDLDAVAFLQFTSGSTGDAKGVMISHGNIMHNQRVITAAFQTSAESVGVCWLPLFHDMGLIGNVFQPLYIGATMVLMPPLAFLQKPVRWLQAISKYRATTIAAPNFGYELCVQMVKPEQCAELDLRSCVLAGSGAEPVRASTLARFQERFAPYGFSPQAFYPCYGLAEATLFVSGGQLGTAPVVLPVNKTLLTTEHRVELQADGQPMVGCGQAWLAHEIAIVDPDSCNRLSEGQIGEIWVRGPSVALGYWEQPTATAETFNGYLAESGEGPFMRTGDLGFLHQGELFVTGRRKELIIIRGQNHYPQDIEQTVEQAHAALQPGSGAAFAVEVGAEERLVIVHEVRRSHRNTINLAEVLAEVRQAIAQEHQLQLHDLVLLETGGLPKTSSGKIQRRACHSSYLAGTLNILGQQEVKS